jgi:hypothetical protein
MRNRYVLSPGSFADNLQFESFVLRLARRRCYTDERYAPVVENPVQLLDYSM